LLRLRFLRALVVIVIVVLFVVVVVVAIAFAVLLGRTCRVVVVDRPLLSPLRRLRFRRVLLLLLSSSASASRGRRIRRDFGLAVQTKNSRRKEGRETFFRGVAREREV